MSPKSPPNNGKSFFKYLAQMTKAALYRVAQRIKIPGRSIMTKSELVRALSKKEPDVAPLLENGVNGKKNPVPAATEPAKKTKRKDVPEKKRTTAESVTSPMPEKEKPSVPQEPSRVWVGEEGPDLPRSYGKTVLLALPRDPHWAFVYWEITDESRQAILREEGEWFFDVAVPVLRIYNAEGKFLQEIPILLDAGSWYVSLDSGPEYEIELAFKRGDGTYRVLVRSNRLVLPPSRPSDATDEEWSIMEEKFEKMLSLSGGFDDASFGGSASAIRHILRHRMRAPWTVSLHEFQSSHLMPSSLSMPSSHSVTKRSK